MVVILVLMVVVVRVMLKAIVIIGCGRGRGSSEGLRSPLLRRVAPQHEPRGAVCVELAQLEGHVSEGAGASSPGASRLSSEPRQQRLQTSAGQSDKAWWSRTDRDAHPISKGAATTFTLSHSLLLHLLLLLVHNCKRHFLSKYLSLVIYSHMPVWVQTLNLNQAVKSFSSSFSCLLAFTF